MGLKIMKIKIKQYRGFVLAEFMASLVVLGILLVCVAMSLGQFRNFNHSQLVRQQCIAAGQGQLDSIAATGEPIDEEQFERLWPQLSVSIERSDGSGEWAGMKLVRVKTSGESPHKNVEVELCRYMPGAQR